MKLTLIWCIFLLFSCSLNKDSKYWTEDHLSPNEKKIKYNTNKKKLPMILKKSADITTMTLEEYEIYIDDHTKKSIYPDIN